ncbi:uncharacterized protein LOC133441046 [Cololabis saira]|uniref:uncharacterized protein LOC133441046 n=1 Tax=Cololabis saira TaxID=129043 RepID=UPI002AD4BADF|nr:uncharacterized protein LOC133441046 [Cololabis saira]
MLAPPAMPFQQPPSFLPQTVPAPQATAHFTLSTANPAVRHPNTFASRPSPVPANLRKQIIDETSCCASFPLRRQELDDYLSNILNLALRFGGNGFYLYHIHFASEAAARLQQFNEATYWGTLDTELYCRIFAARTALTCSLCGAASHPASSCSIPAHAGPHSTRARPSAFSRLSSAAPPPPLLPKHTSSNPSVSIPVTKGIDARGRPIMHQGGRSICNNFNDTGCHMSQCRFLHVCSYCGGGHARPACPHNPTSQKLGEHLSTPINIPALGVALRNHPNPCFVKFLVKGFSEGFHPGIISSPSSSYECKNLLSAINEPESVDRLLAKEVKEGFMIGPFPHPPFPNFRISPLGIATRKYSGKKRIIVDLSAPHGSFIPSINSLIPSEDFSLHYATINHAIALIKLAGKGSWLSKADITSAFKVLPIHPDFWQYFGVRWRGAYYFAVRLTFGCKSSPKLFDTFSEALCWILSNNHGIPFLSPPSSPPASGLVTLTSVFSELGVPLSAEKTEGPSTSLEFLGITLDTDLFQASLPTEKLNRISLLISNFLLAPGCTKRQLLSLLGHLNFAMRIIPQGRAFISHLLSIASAVPSLLSPISLDNSSRAELRLWLNLLATWNGITFFYDDQLAHPHDINLYTDAAPSIGFGGFYDGRWFAAGWPPELANEHYTASSALYEIYPISVAAILWGHEWTRKSILIYSDNLAVVDIINKGRSNSSSIMPFMRRLVLVIHQYILRAAHVPGHSNTIADSLSRFSFQKFRSLAPHADPSPTPVPPYSALTFNV